MSHQQRGNQPKEASAASPLSLLVNAADSQNSQSRIKSNGAVGATNGGNDSKTPVASSQSTSSLSEVTLKQQQQLLQQQQAQLLPLLRGSGLTDPAWFQQHAAFAAAAQQHEQVAALALATDIRNAVAAAQLRQAAQFQNQDLLFMRAAQHLGLGALQPNLGLENLQGVDLLQKQQLEELQRRQMLASAVPGQGQLTSNALAAHQQRDAHSMRQGQQEQAALDRAGLRGPPAPNAVLSSKTTSTTEDNSKDGFQKTPGSVIVPCRARGMPMDHNFKTAYFVIPENVEHGEELICSYYACRNAGIKFRYCTQCRVPVAKRNFRKRHKHATGGKEVESSNSGDDSVSASLKSSNETDKASGPRSQDSSADEAKKKAPTQSPQKPQVPVMGGAKQMEVDTSDQSFTKSISTVTDENKSDSSHSFSSFKRDDSKLSDKSDSAEEEDECPSSSPTPSSSSHNARAVSEDSDSQHGLSAKISEERSSRWASLLAKRPPSKKSSALSAWLVEVLSVSDLEAPMQTASSSGQERPKSPLSNTQDALITKKRNHSMVGDNDDEARADEGSFAEWKDRKKHKGGSNQGFKLQPKD